MTKRHLISSILVLTGFSPALFGLTVTLTATGLQVPVGTPIGWNAQVSGVNQTGPTTPTLWYRYRVRKLGHDFRMVRDFGPRPDLLWAEGESEGAYEMEVTARNLGSGDVATQSVAFHVTPRAYGAPVVSATSHPLVFLYSAPACSGRSTIHLVIQAPNGDLQTTPVQPCEIGLTTNIYLAGLQPNTSYQVHHQILTPHRFGHGADVENGPVMTFKTGSLPPLVAPYTVLKPPPAGSTGVLLQSGIFEASHAIDLNGNIIWYYQSGDLTYLTRPEGDGLFLGLYEDSTKDPSYQVLKEVDFVGYTRLETNAARVSEQLQAMHKHKINSFHHEVERLPNGNIMTLGSVEQILTDVQGPGPVDVMGDMIIVFDQNLQVVWTWDAFDHLDTHRLATLNEICTPTNGLCPPFYLAPQANDWLHGNSLHLTADGSLLYSSRHQDWVIKIDYNNGSGSGNILWRLGKDGDFAIRSTAPYTWFSHQHFSHFEGVDSSMLDLFDNGNVQYAADGSAHSRGQVLKLDERSRVATPVLDADLGAYSLALGSAQLLPNGNHHFDVGYINTATGPLSQSVEVDASGSIVYEIQTTTPVYRTFRMSSLYAPRAEILRMENAP
jgi:hypothetical protein